MKIIIFIFIFMSALLNAQLEWADSYEEAQLQAVKENKGILVVITKESCQWCRKLESITFQDDKVVERIQSKFIPVHIMRDRDEFPTHLVAEMTPISYFLFSNGDPIMRGVIGYWSAEDYISIMDDVDRYMEKHTKK